MEFRNLRGLSSDTPPLPAGITVTPYRIVGAQPGEHIGLPSSTITLVVDLGNGLDLGEPGRAGVRTFQCCLGGMHLEPVTIHHDGSQIGVQVNLDPVAFRALFAMPPGELWSANIDLDAAAPALARRLYDEAGAVAYEDRGLVVRDIIAQALRDSADGADSDAEHAWHLIQRTRGRLTVAKLVELSGWSARRLTGVFTAEYGIGPKQAARLARFEHARARLESGEAIADVAVECGYADQAHLTREFATITGHPPKEFLRVQAAEFSGAS
jgi:AraC-like DNA-binding protein